MPDETSPIRAALPPADWRALRRDEIAAVWQIDRSETIEAVYRLSDGDLRLVPEPHAGAGWPPGEAARGTIESAGSAPPSGRRAPRPHRRHGLRLLALIGLLAGCAPTRLDTAQLEAAIERFERAAAQAEAAAAQAQASARQAELAAQAAAADTDGGAENTISPDQAIERRGVRRTARPRGDHGASIKSSPPAAAPPPPPDERP